MRTLILSLSGLFLISVMTFAQIEEEKKQDEHAIKESVLNYIEGWYEGNPERMSMALDADFSKTGIRSEKNTGKTMLNHVSKSNMVLYTEAEYGKLKEGETMDNKVIVYDIYENTACAKAISRDYIDYILLGRVNGEWKIIKVLWEMKKK